MKAPKNSNKFARRRLYVLNSPGDVPVDNGSKWCVASNQWENERFAPADRNDEYLKHYLSQKSCKKTSKHIPSWIG